MLCLISMIHSVMLFQSLQCRCLLIRREREKSELLIDVFCVFFLLSSLLILNAVSVVFDFNALLNDATPLSLISLPVC